MANDKLLMLCGRGDGGGAAHIANAAVAAAAPTKAEFDALVAKFNTLLLAVEAAGIVKSA